MSVEQKCAELWDMIKDVHFAMLTFVDSSGRLGSRVIVTQQTEFFGELWFFTFLTPLVDSIDGLNVSVAFMHSEADTFVAVSGKASLIIQAASQLSSPVHTNWTPKKMDLEDPNVGWIKVSVTDAYCLKSGTEHRLVFDSESVNLVRPQAREPAKHIDDEPLPEVMEGYKIKVIRQLNHGYADRFSTF